MSEEGLPSDERIRRRSEFERIYKEGARISGRFMTVFLLANGGATQRCGVAATRKLGGAVERNRAKRLAREIFRHHKITPGYDIVIVPRREMLDALFASLEADYDRALARRGTARPGQNPGRRRDGRPRPASRV
ncbi:MAG: ribonuclease P protein component [Vicinamibacterales bacterium]